jgi:hypothetical protein
MGKNSKKNNREYEQRLKDSGTEPSHPSVEDIFEEYTTFGGIWMTQKEADELREKMDGCGKTD